MQNLRIAAVAVNQTPLDWLGNRRRLVKAIDAARAAGAQLVSLPELAISGYGCEDMFFSPGVQQRALDELVELLPHTAGLVVAVGLPIYYESSLYNAAALLADGQLLGLVAKQFLATDGIHYESRWFKKWPADVVGQLEVAGQLYPVGDLLFDLSGVRIGLEICRDAWVAQRPGGRLARRGVDVLLNPSASHFAFGKHAIRERIVLEGARAFGTTYVHCNLLGNESGRSIYDGDTMIASGGKMVARGRRFSFAEWEMVVAEVDLDRGRCLRAQGFDALVAVQPPGEGYLLTSFAWGATPLAEPLTPAREPEPWEQGEQAKCEEFSRAVSLALFDYLRKSGLRGFVVSISGGADSASVTVLVAQMVARAVAELGPDGFINALPAIPSLRQVRQQQPEAENDALVAAFTRELLMCVYQATRHSSATTRHAARQVAEGVGASYVEWDVDAMSQGFVDLVAQALGRELTWETDDVALQNIQARSRGPGAWLLANVRGALLLACSNRSEAAVGYATMDGDTCGGLAPISGIDKDFLRTWLKWMETTGPADLGPVSALAAVNAQQPTAELRPYAASQTDEGDLMPYQVLDAIERAAIRDKQLPAEVYTSMVRQFPGHAPEELGRWVIRFFELWCRNQWKRERYAPSFHVDDENLDPKSWCRFPILNGGFAAELAPLRKELG